MTVSGSASGYQIFVLEARDGKETRIVSIRPETPEAEAAIRARVARVKQSWGAGHSVRVGLASEKEEDEGRAG
jgi:hypothetical protein